MAQVVRDRIEHVWPMERCRHFLKSEIGSSTCMIIENSPTSLVFAENMLPHAPHACISVCFHARMHSCRFTTWLSESSSLLDCQSGLSGSQLLQCRPPNGARPREPCINPTAAVPWRQQCSHAFASRIYGTARRRNGTSSCDGLLARKRSQLTHFAIEQQNIERRRRLRRQWLDLQQRIAKRDERVKLHLIFSLSRILAWSWRIKDVGTRRFRRRAMRMQ